MQRQKQYLHPQTQTQNQSTHQNCTYVGFDYPALCIPRSVKTISLKEIEDTFNKTGLGVVSKVVVKQKTHTLKEWEQIVNNETNIREIEYSNIYVYFKKWNIENPQVSEYRDKLLKGNTIKIVFESIPTPIFWRCSAAIFRS
jgi:hypothetical protein